jgi:hypothetical protein
VTSCKALLPEGARTSATNPYAGRMHRSRILAHRKASEAPPVLYSSCDRGYASLPLPVRCLPLRSKAPSGDSLLLHRIGDGGCRPKGRSGSLDGPARQHMAQMQMPAHRPRPEEHPTAWSYWQARRVWLRRHGGSLLSTLAIAVIFGGLSGSVFLTALLIVFALLGTAYARSRP